MSGGNNAKNAPGSAGIDTEKTIWARRNNNQGVQTGYQIYRPHQYERFEVRDCGNNLFVLYGHFTETEKKKSTSKNEPAELNYFCTKQAALEFARHLAICANNHKKLLDDWFDESLDEEKMHCTPGSAAHVNAHSGV